MRTTIAPATSGACIRCTTTRTASPTRWRTSRTRCARWSSKTIARSTTGCWKSWRNSALLTKPLPQQYEFARLNLTYVVLSKRKLIQLVEEKHVDGWDDPRMPTLVGARRRGFMPEGFRLFAERIGVSKSDSWIDMSVLEDCMRETLNESAPRRASRCSIRSSS